jgi:outer membrane biosynthesis protein TonB
MSTRLCGFATSLHRSLSGSRLVILVLALALQSGLQPAPAAAASDWDEEQPAQTKSSPAEKFAEKQERKNKSAVVREEQQPVSNDNIKEPPLQGKVEKEESASDRIQRPAADLKSLPAQTDEQPKDFKLKAADQNSSLTPLLGQSDPSRTPLQGQVELLGGKTARANDPDEDDVELMVEWDRWHNRFLRAVQLGTQEIVNNPDPEDYERMRMEASSGRLTSRYPIGIGCAFSCIVTADRQIKSLEIIEPSGFPRYDRSVLRAVHQLEGTQILKFPKGSHRLTVIQPGRIKTGNSNEYKYYHFGDVEHVRKP